MIPSTKSKKEKKKRDVKYQYGFGSYTPGRINFYHMEREIQLAGLTF